MAPINPDLQSTQEDIKNVIQDLFQILAQVANYDSTSRPSREALAQDIIALSSSLAQTHRAATLLGPARADKAVPEPLVQYVENGRNPDIYTREFVELVRRMNQLARGKMHAFRAFRDVLAAEIALQMPEVDADVRRVLEGTGGGGGSSNDGGGEQEGAAAGGGGGGGGGVEVVKQQQQQQ
ncbi:uncharacterized protein THITE_2118971 [Thermothielavioides terrestris NRRL 8126]|uniref:Mediator of RNA polymerase II transcription subunit 10 n=1 Tax=Thermothielavioides terrestris (strain ATCC 38088 / NRRL 8126) TaxID=578455 RepID=G2RB47_THETT|nr:uncharacterized protein THITE_2118971 [Thermothielavioides terrestris NRRL 8126]AEO69018.1 hypothetical protein THITE_2118971 [Thermothielavioides terrestris NRRL 8126]